MKDVVSASPLLWTLTCFFESVKKAVVAPSKCLKLASKCVEEFVVVLAINPLLSILPEWNNNLLHLCMIYKTAL